MIVNFIGRIDGAIDVGTRLKVKMMPRRHHNLLAILLLAIALLLLPFSTSQEIQDDVDTNSTAPYVEEEEEDVEPSRAVLFPWFAEALGLVVFYLTTRYVLIIPYTGWMFILGVCMGVGATRLGGDNHLGQSLVMWGDINYEVLLLIFLPGLVFNDSFGLDVHLFGLAIWQCLIYAFPMVLAGTYLTAVVGYYVFPFSWSWNLALTFGSILSATDPVAVSALLEEVGAPPRLKIHIGGESLLNDGSAMVFYTIFSSLFLTELGIKGVGESIDVAGGFALFFRMSLGGAAVGIAFAMGLIFILYFLNRRLTTAENVVQVCSTVTVAYLCYYTSDSVCGASGVIAVLTCGVLTQAFGSAMINDAHMMNAFWELVEQLLNTLLFTLGGLEFGGVISNYGERVDFWTASEWGYLILLWVLLHAIRFACVYSFYPVTSRLGLSTNWKECFFLSYGGLRGAVGISLAIALDNAVWSVTEDNTYRKFTTQLFGMVGGTAFMTLVVNGSTAGPLLQRLGLSKSPETRKEVLNIFKEDYIDNATDDLISLLRDERFACVVNFDHIRHHLNREFTETQDTFYKRLKEKTGCEGDDPNSLLLNIRKTVPEKATTEASVDVDLDGSDAAGKPADNIDAGVLEQLRTTFIEQLKWGYRKQLERGELDGRLAFLAYVIQQGLDFAADDVTKGNPVQDWEFSQRLDYKYVNRVKCWTKRVITLNGLICKKRVEDDRVASGEFKDIRFTVWLSMAIIEAHRVAKEQFKAKLSEKYPNEVNQVLLESEQQTVLAKQAVSEIDSKDVEFVTEHLLCIILLNKRSKYLNGLLKSGLLSEKEVEQVVDVIEKSLDEVHRCGEFKKSERTDLS